MHDDRRDQKPADDEEHINPHESSAERFEAGIEQHDRKNRHCTPAIDLGTIPIAYLWLLRVTAT